MSEIENQKLFNDENLFIGIEKSNNLSIEDYQKQFGKKNIFNFEEVLIRNLIFISLKHYLEANSFTEKEAVFIIFYKLDLSNFAESEIVKNVVKLRQTINDYLPESLMRKEFINEEVWFIQCKLSSLSDSQIFDMDSYQILRQKIRFHLCNIDNYEIKKCGGPLNPLKVFQHFKSCKFGDVIQKGGTGYKINFSNSEIKNLISSAEYVELRNLKINLYHHKNLDKANLKFDNVKVIFKSKVLKRINREQYRGYWNTFHYLLTKTSLQSERLEIEKYIGFFDSQELSFKRLLFKFHGGYTNFLIPIIVSFFCLAFNYTALFWGLGYIEKAFLMVVYPVELFKEVIFKGINFHHSFSSWKLFIFMFEITFIYSTVSLGIAVRKILGFKIFKQ